MVGGGEAFGRCLGHEGGTLTSGIRALINEAPESILAPSTTRGHSEKLAVCKQEEGLWQSPTMLAPSLGLPASSTCEK